jgi:iron(II)-dependent oxidoreductase
VPDDGFIFDNEKWAHAVEVKAFRIARSVVTQGEFLEFVEDGGYRRPELWTQPGWQWRSAEDVRHPIYWRYDVEGQAWLRRHFDKWIPLESARPAANVCWWEADAFARWAGRRLPSEREWEAAARSLDRESFSWGADVWEWTASDFLPYPGFSEDPYKEYSSPWFRTHKSLRGGAWPTQRRLIRPAYRNFYTPDRRDIWAGFRTCALPQRNSRTVD